MSKLVVVDSSDIGYKLYDNSLGFIMKQPQDDQSMVISCTVVYVYVYMCVCVYCMCVCIACVCVLHVCVCGCVCVGVCGCVVCGYIK